MSACFHKFVSGFGAMGDALVCVKCDYSKYPEALPSRAAYKLLGRIIKNDDTYMHYSEFPWVRKHAKVITWSTNSDDYIGYFDKDGKYVEGVYR